MIRSGATSARRIRVQRRPFVVKNDPVQTPQLTNTPIRRPALQPGNAFRVSARAGPIIHAHAGLGQGIRRRRHRFAVQLHVGEAHAGRVLDGEAVLGFDADVFEAEITERTLRQAGQSASRFAIRRLEVAHGDVAKHRRPLLRRDGPCGIPRATRSWPVRSC